MENPQVEGKPDFSTGRICEMLEKASRIRLRASQCMGYFPFCLENNGKTLLWKFSWCSRPVLAIVLLNAYMYFCRAWFAFHMKDFSQIFDLDDTMESFGWTLIDGSHMFCDGCIIFYMLYYRKRIVAYMNKLTSIFDQNLFSSPAEVAVATADTIPAICGQVHFGMLVKGFIKRDRIIYGSLLLGGFLCFVFCVTYFVNMELLASLGPTKGIVYAIAVGLYNLIVVYHFVKICLYEHIIKMLLLGFETLKHAYMAVTEGGGASDPALFKINRNSPSSKIQQTELGVVNFLSKYQKLEALVEEFNDLFGIPILLSLLLLSVVLLHYIFLVCLLIEANEFSWLLLFAIPALVNTVVFFWLCWVSTKLHNEARNAIYTLINVPLKSISKPLRKKAQMIYQKVLSSPPVIWPARFFIVNLSLAVTMMGTLLTYCVILVQFRIAIEGDRKSTRIHGTRSIVST